MTHKEVSVKKHDDGLIDIIGLNKEELRYHILRNSCKLNGIHSHVTKHNPLFSEEAGLTYAKYNKYAMVSKGINDTINAPTEDGTEIDQYVVKMLNLIMFLRKRKSL